MVAVLHGVDLSLYHAKLREQEVGGEQEVSFEEIAQQRALAYRNLELREQAVAESLKRLMFVETQLADQQQRYERIRVAFDEEMAQLRDGVVAEGREQVRQILETIKPKQAKEQLLAMFDDNEIDVVVALLAAMPSSKRAKIVGEFKTPDESEKLAEILDRLRQGIPQITAIDQAQQQLERPTVQGS